MDTKLTLKLEEKIIKKAKIYARIHRTSLSQMIKTYLQKITDESQDEKITPLVKSLSGIIDLSAEYDHKREYADFLIGKYK